MLIWITSLILIEKKKGEIFTLYKQLKLRINVKKAFFTNFYEDFKRF